MSTLVGLAGALLSLTAPYTAAFTPVDPPATDVSVDLVITVGSGCPKGTATARMAEDNSAMIVDFSDYKAVFGVGAARSTDIRRNCQLTVEIRRSAGYTLAIDRIDYSGDAHIEPGARGSVRSNIYWAGMSATQYWSHSLPGPFEGTWHFGDEIGRELLSYEPCGEPRYTNINTELRLAGGTSNGETTTSWISLRPSDGGVSARYHLTWLKCPA